MSHTSAHSCLETYTPPCGVYRVATFVRTLRAHRTFPRAVHLLRACCTLSFTSLVVLHPPSHAL
jgi:hypothetical protein